MEEVIIFFGPEHISARNNAIPNLFTCTCSCISQQFHCPLSDIPSWSDGQLGLGTTCHESHKKRLTSHPKTSHLFTPHTIPHSLSLPPLPLSFFRCSSPSGTSSSSSISSEAPKGSLTRRRFRVLVASSESPTLLGLACKPAFKRLLKAGVLGGAKKRTHSDTCIPLTQFHDGKEGDGTERCISQHELYG